MATVDPTLFTHLQQLTALLAKLNSEIQTHQAAKTAAAQALHGVAEPLARELNSPTTIGALQALIDQRAAALDATVSADAALDLAKHDRQVTIERIKELHGQILQENY